METEHPNNSPTFLMSLFTHQSRLASSSCLPFLPESRLKKLRGWSLRCRNNRRAQANSIARIPSPKGITTRAGPGVTIMMTPIKTTVAPTTKIIVRRACRTAVLACLANSCRTSWSVEPPRGFGALLGVWCMQQKQKSLGQYSTAATHKPIQSSKTSTFGE